MGTVTLQTLFQDAFPAYERAHPFPAHVRRAAHALMPCRTAALGGHSPACPDGHLSRLWSNACRHRSCPPCASLQTERWLTLQRARLLACDHSHVIFPLPHDRKPLWLANVPVMTTRLFQAGRDTLVTLLADPKYLGAQPGMLVALHTWSQTLVLHPHVHCLVTGGGLSPEGPWQAVRTGFVLPVRVIMAVLRGKLLAAIRQALRREDLALPEGMRPQPCLNLLNRLGHPRKTTWNVPSRERSRHGAGVGTSLARSLRGGPSTNARLVAGEGGPRHLHRPGPPGGGGRGERCGPAADVGGGGLSPALAPACPRAADAGGAVVRAVSSHPSGGFGRVPHGAGATAGGGARGTRLADGVCPAR